MKSVILLRTAAALGAFLTLGLVGCKTPADANAPLAVTPALLSVEKNTALGLGQSLVWVRVNAAQNKYTVAAPAATPPATGQPTIAVNFSGPAAGSDFEVTVDGAIASEGGGLQASTKQQTAEAANLPWYYRDINAGRLIIRLPNSLLTGGGDAALRIVNISRNTTATGTAKTSAALAITLAVAVAVPPTPTPQPTLSNVSPAIIVPGQPVTLNGTNFPTTPGTITQIKIDSCHTLTPTNVTATAITFTAPDPLPPKINLTLTTGGRTFTRNNLTVRRKAGAFTEVTPSDSGSAINQTRPRFSLSTTNLSPSSPFETVVRQPAPGSNTRTFQWTQAAPNSAHPGSDLDGIAVSTDGNSVLVHSSDPLRSSEGGAVANFLYTGGCTWTTARLDVLQFGTRSNGTLLLFVAPRFFFSPDGSVAAVIHLNYPAVEPQPTTPPQPAHLPNNIQITVLNLSTGQPIGSTLVQHTGTGFKIEMGLDGTRDAVLVTGERGTFANQSQITTTKIQLP